jgi:hypothetical protein
VINGINRSRFRTTWCLAEDPPDTLTHA